MVILKEEARVKIFGLIRLQIETQFLIPESLCSKIVGIVTYVNIEFV